MSYCGNCGMLIADGWKFCPRCGNKKRPDICPDCGRELRDEWSFCPGCGGSIEEQGTADRSAVTVHTKNEMPMSDDAEEIQRAVPAAITEEPADSGEELWETIEASENPCEPQDSEEEVWYAELTAQRDALREELRLLGERSAELNGTDDEFLKLPAEERRRIREERCEIRTSQGRCHAQLLQISGKLRHLAEQEARRGREIFSREHPAVTCPTCSAKLRRGVDTWPLCPFCGEDVTEPGRIQNNTVLLKLRCGGEGIKRVWYTGSRDFFEYWEAYHSRHRKHEYHYSEGRAVLTAEAAESRGEVVVSEMPDELPALHILLYRERASEDNGGDRADGMRTVNLGALDMTDLSEAERFAFLHLLLADPPSKDRRKFKLE